MRRGRGRGAGTPLYRRKRRPTRAPVPRGDARRRAAPGTADPGRSRASRPGYGGNAPCGWHCRGTRRSSLQQLRLWRGRSSLVGLLQDQRALGSVERPDSVRRLHRGRQRQGNTSLGGRRRDEPPHPQHHAVANGGAAGRGSVWGKALRSDSAWHDKDEFLDVIYWFRQIIAVILGIIWGVVPLKGFVGIAVFCLINAGVLYLYFSSFQQIDEEEYGGTWELTKEGFMTSFALFLVVWIIFYTAIHYD
ncbi:respirasome Complex Assembly Factor 1 [Onychostruthus taczanowskii]|nr:respirasome Complex Assembly Factor 1 [Onychostruthus taczanowskii]